MTSWRPLGTGLLLCLLSSLAHAAGEDAAQEYVGDETCLGCHQDLLHDYAQTVHAKVLTPGNARTPAMARGCEACHGAGAEHVASGGERSGGMISFGSPEPTGVASDNAVCLGCHGSRSRMHWSGSPHQANDLACTSCHVVMRSVSQRHQLSRKTESELCTSCHLMQRAKRFRNAHMPLREGAMTCSSCHAAHGAVNEALLLHDTVNDNCTSCHAGKRGPFLWEHSPVNENCLNCHDAHGSVREKMLKVSVPRLCQQCHIETLHPTEARRPSNKFVVGSGCIQCHQNIHGSNHPSGFGLTR